MEKNISEYTQEELCNLYDEMKVSLEQLDAGQKVIREELLMRMKDDSEIYGEWSVTRVDKKLWSKVTVDEVRELGAVKTVESVDTTKLNKLWKSGAKLPVEPTIISYPLIKRVEVA